MAETKLSRLELLRKRKQEIEQQMKALEAREKEEERKKDTRRKIIVGAAVLAHAARDAAFAKTLRDVLDKAVIEERNRELVAEWLGSVTNEIIATEPTVTPESGEIPLEPTPLGQPLL